MISMSLLALTLCGGVLVEPFRIADSEPGHHQTCVRAAMAPDGHFAVAWVDDLLLSHEHGLDLYIRFFDSTGNPMTEPYQIAKMADTNWIYWPCLEMDTAGNVVLVCEEVDRVRFDDLDNHYIRFQRFAPDGSPVGSAQTLVPQVELGSMGRPIGLSLANNDEFAVTWCALSPLWGYGAWVQRFNREGYPKGNAFLAHDDFGTSVLFCYPQVALNDAGDLVVTWVEFYPSYPRFQVFDAEDEPILAWEPMGHLVVDDSLGTSRVEAYWLDNDRFVLFWIDYVWPWNIAGRVFADRGLTRYPIRRLVHDSMALNWPDPAGRFAVALSSDERFAETHIRSYTDYPDTSDPSKLRWWDHGGGILGYIQNNEPIRRTTLFEYTPPWGADTVNSLINNYPRTQPPAVACCNDRLVWAYSRLNTDTIFEAFAMITDWDMGEGVMESPIHTESPIRLEASLNRLFYDVSGSVTGEAKLTLYSADGRRVLQETIKGKGTWTSSPPSSLPSGVYFARVKAESAKATAKLVILH